MRSAHVAACHVAREQTRGNIVNLASIPLIFVPGGWAVYEGTQAALSIGVPLTFMKFSRNFEAEADFLGMEYMYKAGYDPQSFISFFEKIEAQEKKKPGTLAKAFASHPMTPDRVAAAQKEMRTCCRRAMNTLSIPRNSTRSKAGWRRWRTVTRCRTTRTTRSVRPCGARLPTILGDSGSGSSTGSGSGSQPDDDRPTLKRNDGSSSQSFNCFAELSS